MNNVSMKSFETNKLMQLAGNDSISEAEKVKIITESFKSLTNLTTDMIVSSIVKIKTPSGDVAETRFIKEFIENADKTVIDSIQAHINELKTQNDIKPVEVATTADQQERGAPATISVPINFDNANFFG